MEEGSTFTRGRSHSGNAYLDDKTWGHGGQVLLQSQFEVFINLVWNQERQEMEPSQFLGRMEGSTGTEYKLKHQLENAPDRQEVFPRSSASQNPEI